MIRDGRLSPAIAGAALDQARAERAALVGAEARADEAKLTKLTTIYPRAAEQFRQQIEGIEEALTDSTIVARARPLVHEFCGGRVPVRPSESGDYLVAEVSWNPAPLLLVVGEDARSWNGSGGVLCRLS